MNLSTESCRAFTSQVEEELGAFTLQQRVLTDVVHGRRGALEGFFFSAVHTQTEKLSLVLYLSLFDSRDLRAGAHFVRSNSVAQIFGVEESLLLHFEKLSRPLSPYGDELVLYDTDNDIRAFFESSLEHAGYYLLGIPLRLNGNLNDKLKLYTLDQVIDYFQCTRVIRQGAVTPVSSLDDASLGSNPFSNDSLTVLVLSADFGREGTSFLHRALNLKEVGVSSVQIWQRVSRSREVKLVRELWLSPYIPEKGCHFPFSCHLDKDQELLIPTRRFHGLSLKELLTCPVNHLLRVFRDNDKKNELTREILILQQLQEVGLGEVSLGESAASLSHGQRELLNLCTLLLTSFTDCTFRVIGNFDRFTPHHQRRLFLLLKEHIGNHNRIEYYSTFVELPDALEPERDLTVREELKIDNIELPFVLDTEKVVIPLDGVTVVEGRSLAGKTILLRDQLISVFKKGTFKILKQRSFTPHYIDFSVVPHFGEEPCGSVVGITEDLAIWFAALPESRRYGLTKSDFLSNESPLVDKVKFQDLSFREILSMTFSDSCVFFPEGSHLREELTFLLEAGFSLSTWLSSVSGLPLSARKRLQVVKVLLSHRRLLDKKTRKQTHAILLLDELFSGVPTDLHARFCSMLHRLARRGITIVISSASPVAEAWIDQRWSLAYNEETGKSLISQISGKEIDRYG